MNTRIRRLGIGLLACYLALFVMLNWIQVFNKDALDNHPLNTLKVKQQFNKPRGTVTSADGALLAESVDVPDSKQFPLERHYPEGDLFAHLTGYYSFDHGSSGLERQYDDELTGQTIAQQIRGFADLLDPRPQVGNLTLTVRKDLQAVAKQALGQRNGSVVALDPRTGEILAFWSYPSFDPNQVSSLDTKTSDIAFGLYNADPAKPLLAHQYQETYFPVRRSRWSPGRAACRPAPSTSTTRSIPWPPRTRRRRPTRRSATSGERRAEAPCSTSCGCRATRPSPRWARRRSGRDAIIKGAESFGFNSRPPIDLPAPVESFFPTSFKNDLPALAQSSIGQQRRAGQPAADGAGGRHRGQRGPHHAPPRGAGGA